MFPNQKASSKTSSQYEIVIWDKTIFTLQMPFYTISAKIEIFPNSTQATTVVL